MDSYRHSIQIVIHYGIYIYIPIMMRFTMFHISNNLDPNHTILWTLGPPKKNENMKFFESLEILGEHSI